MPTALVTGGAGFVGSHVVEHLLASGIDVVALDDMSGGFRRNVPPGARLVEASILDEDRVEALCREHRFRWIYHLAAFAAEALSHHARRLTYEVNVLGSAVLVNAAVRHEVECFVFTSSIAVYGGGPSAHDEDSPPRPIDPYGISKLAVEHDLRAARQVFGLRSVVFRPHNVFGERQNLADPCRNVVAIFVRQVLAGEPCTVYGDGLQTRAFTHVAEVAPVIAAAAREEHALDATFNIGADRTCTVLELAEAVQRALGRRTGVRHLPARPEAPHVASDHARLRSALRLPPPVPLAEGIGRMAAWARELDVAPPRRPPALEIGGARAPGWLRDPGDLAR